MLSPSWKTSLVIGSKKVVSLSDISVLISFTFKIHPAYT